MAKDKELKDFPNKLQLRPQFLNKMIRAFLPNFGFVEKIGKDLSFDELVDWYRANSPKSNATIFLGVIPPDYKSPFDKKFPKAPKLEDDATE